MYRKSDFTKDFYKTGEVAKILGVTVRTVLIYDVEGEIKFSRNQSNRRIILKEDLLKYLEEKGMLLDDTQSSKRDVIYARVSSNEQKIKGDLDRQALFIVENVSNLQNPLILKEVGSGLNDKRPNLLKLIDMVLTDKVNNIYITYKDRLTRFGYNYIETICKAKGVSIVVLQNDINTRTVHEELLEDMMSLITSFAGKLYGMRSNKNKVETVYEAEDKKAEGLNKEEIEEFLKKTVDTK